MALQELNYWLTTTEFPTTDASRPVPEVVDVAVIGAGFTGLSAARTLARRGARVAVFESETIGWGASSRNGGMVLTGMKLGVKQLMSMYGRELTRRMYAASLASLDCVEQIVKEEGIDCDFSRCGHLEVACKQKHFDNYERQAEIIEVEFNHKLRVVQTERTERGDRVEHLLRRHGGRSQCGVQSGALCCGTGRGGHEGWGGDIRACTRECDRARVTAGRGGLEDYDIAGFALGA